MTERTILPLEAFLRDYIDIAGGVWDEVEPQVYDLLLPAEAANPGADRDVIRVAFDPEAVPEHPGSQLAGFGTPLFDRLLEDAVRLGRVARAHVGDLNLELRDPAAKVRRTLTLDDDLKVELGTLRALDFPQALFWFEVTFVSDTSESYVLPVGMDLHYARQVRHLAELLREDRLRDEPTRLLPQVKCCRLADAYPQARAEVVRTLGALAGTRRRELSERLDRQIARMKRYYADLRSELGALAERARARGDDTSKYAGRRAAIDREERLRVAELQQKSKLRIELRLANLLIVHQPKLLIAASVSAAQRTSESLQLVWDPLVGMLEAVPCPGCLLPTYKLKANARRQVGCPACSNGPRARL